MVGGIGMTHDELLNKKTQEIPPQRPQDPECQPRRNRVVPGESCDQNGKREIN